MKYLVEHFEKDSYYIVEADNEQDAWEYFLDNLLELDDMADDYYINEVKNV